MGHLILFSWLSFYSLCRDSGKIDEGLFLPFPFVYVAILVLLLAIIFLGILLGKIRRLNRALEATQLALAKEQRLATLGALAAASAHELGSPLSTILLAAKDILSTLPSDSVFLEDVQLIISQSDRCRDILAELSANIREDKNLSYQSLPLSAIIEQAGQLHKLPYIRLVIYKDASDPEPWFFATPDLVHGLGNILQNAFQFAVSQVCVTLRWNQEKIEALIQDDGKGYPIALLPYLGERPSSASKDVKGSDIRKSKGLGIGLFIAKTLLKQRQAEVSFFNDGGACCLIKWPTSMRVVDRQHNPSSQEEKNGITYPR